MVLRVAKRSTVGGGEDPAPALTRGLLLLRRLGDGGPRTLEELARDSGWPKTSVLRCLQSLERMGAVTRDPMDRRFSAGLRLVRADEAAARAALVERYAGELRRLAEGSGQTAELHAWDGSVLTLVDRRVSERAVVTANARVGFQRDLLEVDALTQCVMGWGGWLPGKGRRQWAWDRGETRWLTRREVGEVLVGVREEGVGVDLGINPHGVRRYGRPLLDAGGRLEGVLAVAQVCGPADRGADPGVSALLLSVQSGPLPI
ncbi:MAG: helix-turn-helix domain-containing protein [Planctomycetota bacterium]